MSQKVVTNPTAVAWRCTDCRCQAWRRGEDFYVTQGLWMLTMPPNRRRSIICVGCFEKRLGRKLTKRDFAPWFRNNRWYGDKRRKINKPPSERLQNRMRLGA